MTWGDTYRRYLARGHDHGSAAYAADRAERRAKDRLRYAAFRRGFERGELAHSVEEGLYWRPRAERAEAALQKIANAIKLTEGEWSGAPKMRLEALLRNASAQAEEALKKIDG